MKTVRFATVVAKSGRPRVHLTWTAPMGDVVLKRALKQQRLLTVHQHVRGSKKDYATVGFDAGAEVQFMIFPNSLKSFADQRVIGIQYELLADADTGDSKRSESKKSRPRKTAARKRNKIVPFSAQPDKPAVPATARAKRPTVVRPPLEPGKEQDPVRRAIRDALADLAEGRITKAERSLRALL